jgi:hypothetical protein
MVMKLHRNEINFTGDKSVDTVVQLTKEAAALGKPYLAALKEQLERQNVSVTQD